MLLESMNSCVLDLLGSLADGSREVLVQNTCIPIGRLSLVQPTVQAVDWVDREPCHEPFSAVPLRSSTGSLLPGNIVRPLTRKWFKDVGNLGDPLSVSWSVVETSANVAARLVQRLVLGALLQ